MMVMFKKGSSYRYVVRRLLLVLPTTIIVALLVVVVVFPTINTGVVVVGASGATGNNNVNNTTTTNTTTTNTTTCDCKSVGDSFIVTRLWDINREEWTDQGVIDEFERGFAPLVTNLPGFEEYVSARTLDESTVFFFNIFSTREETAHAAQEGAKEFVRTGALKGAITPNQFTESDMSFHFTSEPCTTKSIKSRYLSTRLWELTPNSNFTIQGVADEFEEGYAPIVTSADGFLEYGGAPVPGTNNIFFYNVFESDVGAASANAGAALFVKLGRLNGNIQKVVFTEGLIGFDYTCALPVPAPLNMTTITSGTIRAIIRMLLTPLLVFAATWILHYSS